MSELPSARASGDGEVRPGAMTAAMRAAAPRSTGPRWLRWALIRDGRVVREEVRPPDRPLVIGEAADADVPLPALGVERHVLADGRGGAWRLRIAPAWSGRLGAGPVATLGVERPDGTREIRLDDDARGRLELGDASLLVQLVERPSERPTPRLPASIDGGVLHGADWWFTAFVTGSFVVHFALVAFLAEMDWPVATAAAVVPDRMVTQIYPEEEPPPELPEEAMDPDAPPDATEDAVAENDDPNRDDARSDDATEAPADRVARRTARPTLDPEAADAVARGVQLQLGTLLAQEGSAVQDLLEHGAPTERQAAILEDVEGNTLATNDVSTRPRERDGGGCASCEHLGGAQALRRGPPGEGLESFEEGRPIEERVVTRVRPVGDLIRDPIYPPDFDPRALNRRFRGLLPALRRCYEHQITHGDPDLAGRLTLAMRVMPVGTVDSVRATDNTTGSYALATCVTRVVRRLRVTPGPSEPVDVRYPVVFTRGTD